MAKIMANISNFQRNIAKAKKLAESGLPDEIDVDIDAQIGKLQAKLKRAEGILTTIPPRKEVDLDANTQKAIENINRFKTVVDRVPERTTTNVNASTESAKSRLDNLINVIRRIPNETNTKVDANTAKAEYNLKHVTETLYKMPREKNVQIDVDTGKAILETLEFMATLMAVPDKKKVELEVNTEKLNKYDAIMQDFENRVQRLATRIRSFGTVFQQTFSGVMLASIQGIIPIIASLVPAIMAVGNALAVVSGGALGLVGSFGIAYASFGAFAGMAVTALKMLKDGTLQATAETQKYQSSLNKLKDAWQGIIKQNQAQIFNTLSNGINTATYAIQKMTPFLNGVAKGMEKASQGVLKWAQNSQTASRFFNMMNTTGVKTFNTLLSAAGKFGDGLVNVFTQLAPLFLWTTQQLDKLAGAFQKWANSAQGQNSIKQFIEYTKTNLPKIGQIFTNVFAGIANLMGAFAQNSSGIFDWLVKLTGQFRQWSEQVGKSEGFKKFIQYVQQNGPVIMQLIGNIVRALVAFGTAMAPIASVILRVVTALTGFIAKLFETHPAIARMVGLAVALGGMLWALSMPLMMINSVLGMFDSSLMIVAGKILEFISKGQLLSRIGGIIANAFKLITGPLERLAGLFTGAGEGAGIFAGAIEALSGPIGWIIAGIVALVGIIVWLWKTNEQFRNACINAWNSIKNAVMGAVQSVINWFTQLWTSIQQTLKPIMPLLQQVGKVLNDVLGVVFIGIINGVVTAFQMLWTIVSISFTALGGIISAVVQLIVGIFTAFIQFITGDFSDAWHTLSTTIQNVMTTIWNTIVNIWNIISNFIFDVMNRIIGTHITSWGQIWQIVSSFVTRIWTTVTSWFGRVAMSIWQHMISALNHIITVGAQWVVSIGLAIANFVQRVVSGFVRVVLTVATHMLQGLSRVISGGAQWVSAIVNAMARFVSGVINGFFRVVAQVGVGMSNAYHRALSFVGSFFSAGVQLISSIAQGVASAAYKVASAVGSAVSNAWHAVTSFVSGHGGRGSGAIGGRAMAEAQTLATKASDLYKDTFRSNLTDGLGGSIGLNGDAHLTNDVQHSIKESNRPIVNLTVRNEGDIEMIKSHIDQIDSKDASFNLL